MSWTTSTMNPLKLWPTRMKGRVKNTCSVKNTALTAVLGELVDLLHKIEVVPWSTNHMWGAWHSEIGFTLSSRPPAWRYSIAMIQSRTVFVFCSELEANLGNFQLDFSYLLSFFIRPLLKGCLRCQGEVLSDPLVVVFGPVVTIGRSHVRLHVRVKQVRPFGKGNHLLSWESIRLRTSTFRKLCFSTFLTFSTRVEHDVDVGIVQKFWKVSKATPFQL